MKNGDSVEFQLTDSQGNALADQELKITFASTTGAPQNFTITTDSQGKGALVLDGEEDGNYTVIVSYSGDGNYNGCSEKQTITVGDVDSDYTESYSSEYDSYSYDSSSDLSYDSELNVYYDSNGIIRGGQSDGYSLQEARNGPEIDAEGNLV